jgi:hypothetical protein
MRDPYICPHCDQRSTRRWNLDVHIKRRHGGYLLGESSGRHMDNTFEPTYLRQQAPLGLPQYSPSAMYRPLPTIDEQRYGSSLSQDAIQKIHKLKLMNNHHIPDGMIRLAMFNSINGDNTLLDQMLEQLSRLDSLIRGRMVITSRNHIIFFAINFCYYPDL